MNDTKKTILHDKLKEIRTSSGLTQAQIAKKLFISRSCWANYESGSRAPTIEMLQKIASCFQISMDYLFGLSSDNKITASILKEKDINNDIVQNRYLDLLTLSFCNQVALLEFYQHLRFKEKYEKEYDISKEGKKQ